MEKLDSLLSYAVSENVFPGAVLLVSNRDRIIYHRAHGRRSIVPHELPMHRDTVFDLASLTKPLATGLVCMKLVSEKKLDIDMPISQILGKEVPDEKKAVTSRMLLCHSSGLRDWVAFFRRLEPFPLEERKGLVRRMILEMPLDYEPGRASLYSDLGFMLLEWIIEEVAGDSLSACLRRWFLDPLRLERAFLWEKREHSEAAAEYVAATERCPWRGRVIQGEVHDENAYVLGGHSGHSGLFGNAAEVHMLARMLMEHLEGKRSDILQPQVVSRFFEKQAHQGDGSWALAWDTPSPEGSSAGMHFSGKSVGHLGFTGTSIWMDPERGVISILLTNRVHPTRENTRIKAFRPLIHDAVMESVGIAG